jgi:ADP-heptose:LPS heptosyltransferase
VSEVLFVELLGGFGDLLLALPAVHALARSRPGTRVHVATFDPGGELLARDPLVASVATTSDHGEGAPRRFVEGLLAHRPYDLAVTTTTYGGIPELLRAHVPAVADALWRRPPPDELVDERFLRLLAADGLIRPELVRLPPRVALDRAEVDAGHGLLGDRAPVLVLPDAGMAVKRWPYWAALVRALGDLDVVTAPGPGSPPQAPGARVLPPQGLRALAGLAAAVGERGGVVVGADTGPVRLAAAAGARTVGLFGPTLASRYGQRPADGHLALQGLPGCEVRRPVAITEQACWWSGACPLTGGPPACMVDLSADEVVAAVRSALQVPRAA